MDKKEIRTQSLTRRDGLEASYRREADYKIYQALTAMECYQMAKLILIYMSYKSEVDTKRILEHALSSGKQAAVPKVLDKSGIMEFYLITSAKELIKGYQGILEPDIKKSPQINIASYSGEILMLMPGIAFDTRCNRIGYGGGFYDRYLNKYKNSHMHTVALSYNVQIVDNIGADLLDVRPDKVLTETDCYENKWKGRMKQ